MAAPTPCDNCEIRVSVQRYAAEFVWDALLAESMRNEKPCCGTSPLMKRQWTRPAEYSIDEACEIKPPMITSQTKAGSRGRRSLCTRHFSVYLKHWTSKVRSIHQLDAVDVIMHVSSTRCDTVTIPLPQCSSATTQSLMSNVARPNTDKELFSFDNGKNKF
ncbi:hypothetical protein CISG_01561 [Coccidioides immitis RMSCC 3703]|uniref:Uncharacterized protein n=1 Tax=Coccidioides immitis RMSCC 3703 TaxID=454286 RepID=A0A0J8R0E3_COCIT|nr:hypothetical protein CISG_01561 [Coccidioides immitis RMSCC 3703]